MRHKILFDTGSRSFSANYEFSGHSVFEFADGKRDATYGNGTYPIPEHAKNFRVSGKFVTKSDIKCENVDASGKSVFANVKCTNFKASGKTVAKTVKCDKFYASGRIDCDSVVASKAVFGPQIGGEIGSLTASVVDIGGNDFKDKHPVLSWVADKVLDKKSLHIKKLDCDTAYLDGDVTIDVMRCSGICKVKGDKVKILKEEK